MPAEDQAEIELLASQLDSVDICVKLKVDGLPEKHLKIIAPFFGLEFQSTAGSNTWQVQTLNPESGTHKIQTVRLLATALLIHSHFPNAKMALMNSAEIETGSPLTLSEASQIFLKHAGFQLKVENSNRSIDASEMVHLMNQLEQLQSHQHRRKGA